MVNSIFWCPPYINILKVCITLGLVYLQYLPFNLNHFLKILFIFREGKSGRKREWDIYVREELIDCLLLAPPRGSQPATKACALTSTNQPPFTSGTIPNPLSPKGQGLLCAKWRTFCGKLPSCSYHTSLYPNLWQLLG